MIGSKHSLLIRAKLLLIVASISIDSLQMREYSSTDEWNGQDVSNKSNTSISNHLKGMPREQNESKFIVSLDAEKSNLVQVNMAPQVNISLLSFEQVPSAFATATATTTKRSSYSRNNDRLQGSNVNELRSLMEIGMTSVETEVTTMTTEQEKAKTAKMTTTIITKRGSHYQSSGEKEFENLAESGKSK